MILDTSAIVAVVFKEPGFETVVRKIAAADVVAIGSPSAAEAAIVLDARLGSIGRDILIRLLHEWTITIVPFGEDHWKQAAEAYVRFGRGHHKAGLNFGIVWRTRWRSCPGSPCFAWEMTSRRPIWPWREKRSQVEPAS